MVHARWYDESEHLVFEEQLGGHLAWSSVMEPETGRKWGQKSNGKRWVRSGRAPLVIISTLPFTLSRIGNRESI